MTTKKPLSRIAEALFHYSKGKRIEGPHSSLTGDCTGLRGDCAERALTIIKIKAAA